MGRDKIRINDLLLTVPLLTGAVWPKPPGQPALQPILVSLVVPFDISASAATDDLTYTINYSLLCSTLRDSFNDKSLPIEDLETLSSMIFDVLFSRHDIALDEVNLTLVQTRAPLNCKSARIEVTAKRSSGASWVANWTAHSCQDMECSAIIGVNDCEREERQIVRFNVDVEWKDCGVQKLDFRALTRRLYEKVSQSSFKMLEALASYIAEETLRYLNPTSQVPLVTVRAAKPSAIVFAASSEIEISRTFSDFPAIFNAPSHEEPELVALAIGSNLGDRFYNVELALRLLEAPQHLGFDSSFATVVDTSFLYETAPMYVTEQPSFLNCACLIHTNLEPLDLLKFLKLIEELVGRVPSIRNGPRAIDLDIVFYGNRVVDTRRNPRKELDDLNGELVIPHPRLSEREFVLRPLNDMVPDFVHPIFHRKMAALLTALNISVPPMQKVIPFPRCPFPADDTNPHAFIDPVPSTLTSWTHAESSKTRVMATLNTTPDSFSDGSTHNTLATAMQYAQESVAAGASILDVGGYSTRPGAAFVTPEEEVARISPCISGIRKAHTELPMSIDTFRPAVARAAIFAGANCINDVHAFTGPDSYPFSDKAVSTSHKSMAEMKSLAREFAVPVILMHSRGDAGVNKDYGAYNYAGARSAVVEGVRVELGAKVDLIVKGQGGIRRWLVIVDPGIGFSKTLDGNLELLRSAASITADVQIGTGSLRKRNPLSGYPQLIGPSRKSFLGVILEQASGRKTEPNERDWATASAVACAVQQSALVIRVHHTQALTDVVHVANSIHRFL
ncbi:Folic acid synthesis protein [Mycena indigotica]|uniref:Folic acid synthesis protein n=1 Tax=Mycena indigotica TaxID=2126181 RepID=A0A8H6VWM5_9AGAR|nr:Folic acid synthesis protein [Mycena indigotica]KAF7292863.1 Folic acid synthesis protein [Mycena indigotica]